jgi:outer membrane protein assembly factor BamD
MKIKGIILGLMTALMVLSSCSTFQKVLNSTDNDQKYEAAVEFYGNGDYYKALRLFEDVKSVYKATDKEEDVLYYLAQCYYNQKDYVLGSYYFNRFWKDFPESENAEEALFLSAYCYYLDSPRFSLDQTTTIEAMKEFQTFINAYPTSTRIAECNNLLDGLRDKLEKKAYETATLYYKIGDFQAAVISYENLLEHFPDTDYREEVLFMILKARYIFASKSIENKQKERFGSTIKSYNTLLKYFPETEYLKEANLIQENSLKYLN